jgi:hypothetical protein
MRRSNLEAFGGSSCATGSGAVGRHVGVAPPRDDRLKGRCRVQNSGSGRGDVGLRGLGNSLYVSDNRADRLYRVEPADFLNARDIPQISIVFAGKSVHPNGLYPAKDGSLLVVGFMSPKDARGIYALGRDGELRELAKGVGRLDGVYQMADGSLLVSEWNSGSLLRWSAGGSMETLASGFKGPADFAVVPERNGIMVVVPDLPASQLRMVRLGR